jgi:hypothetical protein
MNQQRYMVHERREVNNMSSVISLVDEKDHKILKEYRYTFNPDYPGTNSGIIHNSLGSRMGKLIWNLEQASKRSSVGYYSDKDYINEFCFTLYSWHTNQKVILLEPEALKDVIIESFEDNFEAIKQLKEVGL